MIAVEPPRPRILLIPEGALYLAFRLPRLFRKAGWAVDLLCVPGDPLARSRYISTPIQARTMDELFSRVQNILRDPHCPWQSVVVAHEGVARRLIATGDDELLRRWQPGAMDPVVREFLVSKLGLEAAHQGRRLNVPPSRVCRSWREIGQFGQDTGWPVVGKPPDESGGVGVVKYHSPEELEWNHSSLRFPILAQKYIQGRHGVVEMLCSAGRPLAWLTSYLVKRSGGEFTGSTARLFCSMPELGPLVEQVARFTKFEGFCGFDWIEEEETGSHHLIEFHPRPPPGFRFGRFCGLNFPTAIAAWLRRETEGFPPQVQAPGSAVAAHYFSGDLLRCLRQRDWRGLKPWLPGSGACHDVFWEDVPLLATWGAQRCWRLFKGCFPVL